MVHLRQRSNLKKYVFFFVDDRKYLYTQYRQDSVETRSLKEVSDFNVCNYNVRNYYVRNSVV